MQTKIILFSRKKKKKTKTKLKKRKTNKQLLQQIDVTSINYKFGMSKLFFINEEKIKKFFNIRKIRTDWITTKINMKHKYENPFGSRKMINKIFNVNA